MIRRPPESPLFPSTTLFRSNRFTAELNDKLEQVVKAALADRKPARLSWGVGRVGFAKNRRAAGGPTDHDLPVLVVRGTDNKVRDRKSTRLNSSHANISYAVF